MKMFGNMTTDGLETSGDRLGGGGVQESGAYDAKIKAAYVGKAQNSNAQSITVMLDAGGREIRQTIWITTKDGNNFYPDKQDPTKRHILPGFATIDELCLLTTGQPLSEQSVEDKVLSLYDFEAKKEIPQNVPVLTALTGQPITVGLIKQIVDKNKKDSAGNYVPSGETREENEIDKFFHHDTKMTVTEYREGLEEAVFYPKWVEKNRGKTRNRAKGAEGKAGAPGRPAGAPPAAQNQAPKTSLFAKK